MIDLDLLRANENALEDELKKRFISDVNLKEIKELDQQRRTKIAELEQLQAEHKKQSAEIGKAKGTARGSQMRKAKKLAAKVKEFEPEVREVGQRFFEKAALLPNRAHESVPVGKDEKSNKVAAEYGTKPIFDFPVKTHWELAEKIGGLDSKRGARLSGSRFNYVMGDVALLQFALLRFALDEVLQKGFVPVLPPVLVKEEALFGAGTFPIDRAEVYRLADDPLYLTGTSEIALLNIHAHESVELKEGQLRYTGYSTNFRREAGAYGKDIRGMIRTHQFDKLELFVFADQERSWEIFENDLLLICEGLLKKLGLHFRRVILSTGDLPRKFQKTYDLETWLPSEKRYLETHSISHAGDFQARRLGIKYKAASGQRRFVHTLNATGFAFSRMPVVIMENFQQADGRVAIPEVLQPYMGNREYLGATT